MENGLKDETPKIQTDVKEALLWKRAQLTRELKELDAIISEVQREYSLRLEQLLVQKKPLEDALYHVEALLRFEGPSIKNNQDVGRDRATPLVAARASVIDAVLSLLEERHQPMHYKDIAAKLQEENTYIPGKNPAATLLSRMNRDSRFKRTKKRGTYALSTWRGHSADFTNILIDANVGNVKEFVSSTPQGKQVFLFRQPWSRISLFAFGVYGKG
jgi:HB1, ASXL, restriction endonuclease HTH domain